MSHDSIKDVKDVDFKRGTSMEGWSESRGFQQPTCWLLSGIACRTSRSWRFAQLIQTGFIPTRSWHFTSCITKQRIRKSLGSLTCGVYMERLCTCWSVMKRKESFESISQTIQKSTNRSLEWEEFLPGIGTVCTTSQQLGKGFWLPVLSEQLFVSKIIGPCGLFLLIPCYSQAKKMLWH